MVQHLLWLYISVSIILPREECAHKRKKSSCKLMKRMAKPVFVSSLYLILSLTPIHDARSCKNKSRRRAAKTKRTNVLSLRRESNKKSTRCDVSLRCLLIIRAAIFLRENQFLTAEAGD
jgi:hypothetical protein